MDCRSVRGGIFLGCLIFPMPRYKAMGSGTWAIDTWTGKIYGYASLPNPLKPN
jgi:hypothetical protein